ncbi:MAG: hypothetical protein IIB33_01775 [Chloroflexi bacterium]|nr:hypothetical protein [Chloroflexota bacterium]
MPDVTRIRVGDQEHDAIEQQFESEKEYWNVYKLLDGGEVRIKTTAQKIYRIVDADGRPTVTEEGDPHVLVRHTTQVVSSK